MGLSGPSSIRKKRIGHDPNNTTWSKSTDGFGHKILTAHGWKPGQLLGAENAPHAAHLTAANASHIRVALRADNLGLGAQVGKSNAETFGLSTLTGIFGRLNGKSDADVQKIENAQRDIELRTYQSQRFGSLTFVSGGLLVGDKMQPSKAESSNTQDNDPGRPEKKRKRAASVESSIKETEEATRIKTDNESNEEDQQAERPDVLQHESISKVKQKRDVEGDSALTRRELKALRKAEKRERKANRKRDRAHCSGEPKKDEPSRKLDDDQVPTAKITIAQPMASQLHFAGGRHAVRQRYIQQKRLAMSDSRAMNEILMLQSAVT